MGSSCWTGCPRRRDDHHPCPIRCLSQTVCPEEKPTRCLRADACRQSSKSRKCSRNAVYSCVCCLPAAGPRTNVSPRDHKVQPRSAHLDHTIVIATSDEILIDAVHPIDRDTERQLHPCDSRNHLLTRVLPLFLSSYCPTPRSNDCD